MSPEHGVAYELVTIPGAEHGLGGGDPQLVAGAYDEALAWVNRYMRYAPTQSTWS